MPSERAITQMVDLFTDVIDLGGVEERTAIVPNLTVIDAAPTGLTNFIIVQDDRDGDNILAKTVPGVVYANSDKVNVLFIRGTEPIAFQQGSESSSANLWQIVPSTSTDIFYNSGNVGIGNVTPAHPLDVTGKILSDDSVSSDKFAFIIENTSGATASANDVGHIDEAGEYKTTTTANADVSWCVVIIGGANNADIYVARRGRATVSYTGTAPSVGHFLTTSAVAGDAQRSTAMRAEIFAVATAAGAGGTVKVLLLTERKYIPFNSTNNLLRINGTSGSDFVSTIAAAGVIGDKVYYNVPSSGNVNAITPVTSIEIGKLVLHNTTQTLEAFIIATGTDGTGNFIQVSVAADIAAWVATDAITARSQTNTTQPTAGTYFFDLNLSETTEIPLLTTLLWFALHNWVDSGGVGQQMILHPFEANSGSKRQRSETVSTTENTGLNLSMGLISQRLVISYTASGAATASLNLRARGMVIATP